MHQYPIESPEKKRLEESVSKALKNKPTPPKRKHERSV